MPLQKTPNRVISSLCVFFFILTSCSASDQQRSTVGMRLLGEASEVQTSLSGEPVDSEASEIATSTTLSVVNVPSTTLTTETQPPLPTNTNKISVTTTTTTLFVETPDKPFYAATAINSTLEAFRNQADSEARWILSNPGPFEGDRVLLVRNIEENWIQVSMPIRPHGTNAWVKRDSVSLSEYKSKVILDKYSGLLEGWKNGELIFKESFYSGSDEHPTPLGDFYINEIQDATADNLNRRLVGITAFSTTIDPSSEGDPAIAFFAHDSSEGSDELSTRGCIRISENVLELLVDFPLGTPVQIVG